jgi:hypothetical protein
MMRQGPDDVMALPCAQADQPHLARGCLLDRIDQV